MLVVAVVALQLVVPLSGVATAIGGSAEALQPSRPDAMSARLAAQATGVPVETTDATTETLRRWMNPDGSVTDELAVAPVRMWSGGEWIDIDTTLSVRAGAVRPAATMGQISLSPGGAGALATVSRGAHSVSLGWLGVLPQPVLDGNTARYVDALPGTDIEVAALSAGFEQSYVLKTRAALVAAAHLQLPLSSPGLTPQPRDGSLAFVDASGVEQAWVGSALMWDAAGRTAPVGVHVVSTPLGRVLQITPDALFLADPTVVLPVTVDPQIYVYRFRDSYINSAATTTNYGTNTVLKIGLRGTAQYISYLAYDLAPTYTGKHFTNVTQYLGAVDSVSCAAKTTTLYEVTSGWNQTTITWDNRPTTDVGTTGFLAQSTAAAGGPTGSTCDAFGWLSFNDSRLTAEFQDWADSESTNYGMSIRASATDSLAAKDFASGENAAWTPRAQLTYCDGIPTSPKTVTGTAGNGSVAVSWQPPDSDGGCTVTGYTVTASPGGATATTSGATSATVSGLTNGTAYTFKVTATTAAGTSAPSTASSPVTPRTVPGAPTGVTGSPGNGTVALSWTAPTSTGGAAITSYTVTASPGGATATTPTPAAGQPVDKQITMTGLTNGTPYTFTVRATNAAGSGASSAASAQITPRTVPGVATSVTGAPGDGSVAVDWDAAPDGGSAITSYTVTAQPGGATATTPTPAAGQPVGTQLTVTGLTNGTPYTFTVRATNAVGNGASSAASAPITPRTVPGVATSVTGTPGDGSVAVDWDAASDGGSAITSYTVTAQPGGATATTPTPAAGQPVDTQLTVTGLTNGTPYTFTVRATNAAGVGGSSSASTTVTPRTTPGVPTNVAGTAQNGSVALTWSAPASNGGAAILQYVATASPGGATTSNTGGTSLLFPGLSNGTAYTFTVVAVNAAGAGSASSSSSAVTPRAAPGAPTDVTGTPGNASVALSWTAPASDGGATISGYTVFAEPGVASQSASGTSLNFTGLTNGTAYTFTVVANNTAGGGSASAPSAPITPRTTPGLPTNVTGTAGPASVALTWTAAPSNGAAVTSYTVTASPGGAQLSTSGATSLTFTGLANGTAYTFTVTATNAAGTGAASAPSAALTPRTTPGAPTAVTGSPNDRSVAVTWVAPSSTGGSAITGYTVIASPGGASVTTTGATSATVSGLTNGTPYTFTVAASNAAGTGSASAASPAVTPRTTPGAATNLAGTPGDGSAILSWTAAPDGGAAVTYTVTATPGGASATTSATTAIVTGLSNGTAYTFRVVATNAAGSGPASSASAAVTPRTVPGAPAGLTGAPGDGSVTLSWTAPASNGGAVITQYIATATPGGATTSNSGGTSMVFPGLNNGTAYTFTVKAVNTAGASSPSPASPSVTPRTVPGAPTAVTARAIHTAALVSWSAPNTDGGSPVTQYRVTTTPATTTVTTGGATSVTVGNLTNGTSYAFTVTAVNVAGEGAPSGPSTAVTPHDTPPAAPANVSAVAGTSGSADVTWTLPPTDGESPISKFTVVAAPGGRSAVEAGATATTARVTGLALGGTYTFTVLAENLAGYGAVSSASNSVSVAGPASPTGISVTTVAGDPDDLSVSWTAPADNGVPITGYRVLSSPEDRCATTSGSTATSARMSNLAPGTTYSMRVMALTGGTPGCEPSSGDGPVSAASTPVALPWAAPHADIKNALPKDGAIDVLWMPDPSATSQVVTVNPGGITRTLSGRVARATIGGLTNGVTYSVTVTAYNSAGSAVSPALSATPSPRLVSQLEEVSWGVQPQTGAVSDDGRYVAWSENDTGCGCDTAWSYYSFIADRTERVSYLISHERSVTDRADAATISGNGRWVVFSSDDSMIPSDVNWAQDVYVLDRQNDTLRLVSTAADGTQGNASSVAMKVSPDGRHVIFGSLASNLTPGDTNSAYDLFVKDLATGSLERVSVASDGTPLRGVANRDGHPGQADAALSADGRYVAGTFDEGVFWRDRQTGQTRTVKAPFSTERSELGGLSRNGRVVTFNDRTDGVKELRSRPASYLSTYQQDMVADDFPHIVSIADNGVDMDGPSVLGVSPDASLIAMVDNYHLLIRDTAAARTSILVPGLRFDDHAKDLAAIAANNRSIVVHYGDLFDKYYAVEFQREGNAAGRVWYAGWRQSVNTASGAYSTTATDAELVTSGPPLSLVRTYNSNDYSRDSAFGLGFSSSFEYSLESRGTGFLISYPDGRRELHTGSGPAYTAPKSTASRLVKNDDGTFTLTQRDQSKTTFNALGKPTALSNPQGRRQLLGYTGGQLSTMTDEASGRQFALTWVNGHVTQVTTAPTVLTWTYSYIDSKLMSVCAPPQPDTASRCVRHEYDGPRMSATFNAYDQRTVHITYWPDGRVKTSSTDGGATSASAFAYPAPARTEITDALGHTTAHNYDDFGRLKKQTDPYGRTVTHAYDSGGYPASVVDENGISTTSTYSPSGDKLSETVNGRSAYLSYDAAHNLVATRDRRTASATDDSFRTSYVYDARNNITSQTSPPVPGYPSGTVKTWTYYNGTEAADGGGMVPAGLLKSAFDERGKTTSYRYNAKGDLVEVLAPLGLRSRYSHDPHGRVLTTTVYSGAYPTGVTTTSVYDELGRKTRETGPRTTDPATNAVHRLRTLSEFDRAGRLVSVSQDDVDGTDATRVTTYSVDAAGRVTATSDNETGATEHYDYDDVGNLVKVTDRLDRVTTIDYTQVNLREQMTRRDVVAPDGSPRDVVVATWQYDQAGRPVIETDALGRRYRHDYDSDNRETALTLLDYLDRDGTRRDVVVDQRSYDAVGNVTERRTGNGRRVETFTYDALDRLTASVVDPTGLKRRTELTYDAAGNELTRVLRHDVAGGRVETHTRTVDDLGNPVSVTVENGANDVTTWTRYDDRGLLVAVTDPRGAASGDAAYTTDFAYDELGRHYRTLDPAVLVEQPAQVAFAPTDARYSTALSAALLRAATPSTPEGGYEGVDLAADGAEPARTEQLIGYDTFGAVASTRDAAGALTTTAYDLLGRRTRIDHPAYTRPDGTVLTAYETWSYDDTNRLTEHRDRRGGLTSSDYDDLDHLLTRRDPAVAAGTPTTAFRHDDAGRLLKTTDPIGAVTEYTHDDLDRVRTTTSVLRTAGASQRATVTIDYDDLANPTYTRTPTGAVWTRDYNPAGELTTSTDPIGKVETRSYDVAGRLTTVTDPLLRTTRRSYDLAGRATSLGRYSPDGTLLTTEIADFDAAGNETSRTSARGFTSTRRYDSLSRLLAITEPVDATTWRTTGFGYDLAGRLVRSTDGRGHDTVDLASKNSATFDVAFSYTPWNQPESVVEPATAAHPLPADRTWTTTYDAGGLPVTETRPGGVSVTRVYDALGRMTNETGTDSTQLAPTTATRSASYDLAGRLLGVNHPAGTQTFGYDDRGLLTSAAGPAGASSFSYDLSARMTRRTDAAGEHTFTWTSRDEVDTATQPLTGTTLDHGYDAAGQLTSTTMTGGGARQLTYDDLGRMSSDRLLAGGVERASTQYGYDPDGNVTAQTNALPGNPANGVHAYGYDRVGRLTSWTAPGTAALSYGWDGADNRTAVGSAAFSYDQRSRLTSGPAGAYTWSPRGTLASAGTTSYAFDPLDRLTRVGATPYTYDGLDRLATRAGGPFGYAGTEIDAMSDATATYGRGPAGELSEVSVAGAPRLVALNRHGDVSLTHTPSGEPSATKAYSPFGVDAGSTGAAPGGVGFQADYSDPSSALVWMGGRWYDPNAGVFTSRDTMARRLDSRKLINRYGYANASPLTLSDPDGHCATTSTGWGGCSLDAGPASYQVSFLAGAFSDSTNRYVIPPQPRPQPTPDYGVDPLNDPDPEVRAVAWMEGGMRGRGYAKLTSDPLSRWFAARKGLAVAALAVTPYIGDGIDLFSCIGGDKLSCAAIAPVLGAAANAKKLRRALDAAHDADNITDTIRAVDHVDDAHETLRAANHIDNATDGARAARARIFADDPVSFTATRAKGTGKTYDVYQRGDVDWSRVRVGGDSRGVGLSNSEAARKLGLAPELDDGSFATLHHIGQNADGPLAEASTRYHGVGKPGQTTLHGQFGHNMPHPTNPIDRRAFTVDNREYWKSRVGNG